MPESHPRIFYVIGSFPEKTESFVFNELRHLLKMGFDVSVFSVYGARPLDGGGEWGARTVYAEPVWSAGIVTAHLYFLVTSPVKYFRTMMRFREFRGRRVAWKSAYFSRQVIARGVTHIHAQFAWVATDMARLISELTGVSYSLTAHQSDINRHADSDLSEKLNGAKYIFTCTKGNRAALGRKFGETILAKTTAIYHGVDLERFRGDGDESRRSPEIDILSIGNLIDVKGFDYLIRACGKIKERGLSYKCLILGGGSEKEALEELISRMNLRDVVEIRSPVPHDKIGQIYENARVFALPVVMIDGAPHGVPNVLMEAMAMGLPVVSCDVPDIPELIEHGKNGLLVSEKDVEALADALEALLLSRELRKNLGQAARRRVEDAFDTAVHIHQIADAFTN